MYTHTYVPINIRYIVSAHISFEVMRLTSYGF